MKYEIRAFYAFESDDELKLHDTALFEEFLAMALERGDVEIDVEVKQSAKDE